jgi:hypothetical protein
MFIGFVVGESQKLTPPQPSPSLREREGAEPPALAALMPRPWLLFPLLFLLLFLPLFLL